MCRNLILILFVSLASGCATVPAPPPVVTASGPYEPTDLKDAALVVRFRDSAIAAGGESPTEQQLQTMLDDGFGLVYAHCNIFFRSSGEKQSQLLVLSDAIASLGTLAGAALAIGDRDGKGTGDALAIVNFGTSATMAGIDIYARRYLFGAENIDAVRDLTLNALVTHADEARKLKPTTYQAVLRHLFDNQALCTPAKITILAREAIQKGKVVPSTIGADSLSQLGRNTDQVILKRLGAVLNPPGAVSAEQAGALYWLLFADATKVERLKIIAPALDGLPETNRPSFDANGLLKSPVPHQTEIESALMGLRTETRRAFEKRIRDIRADGGQGGAAAPLPGALFEVAPETGPADGARISIGVQ